MTAYVELQAELAATLRNGHQRAISLLDAGIEPGAPGIAALIAFYREFTTLNIRDGDDRWRRREFFERFVQDGHIDPAGIADPNTGDTWLHLVCVGITTAAELDMLLEHGAGAVINAGNADGNTPLHCYLGRSFGWRCSLPSEKGLRRLLDYGADPSLLNRAGATPVDVLKAKSVSPAGYAGKRREALLKILNEEPGK